MKYGILKRAPVIFLILCFLYSNLYADTLTGKIRMVPRELESWLDELFRDYKNDNSPGVSVIIADDRDILFQKSYGMANIGLAVPYGPHHAVRLPYSEGREFMAVAAALAHLDGLIDLNNTIRSYFPELPEWSDPVSIFDLIRHQSGFVDEWSVLLLMHDSMSNNFETEQFMRLLATQPVPEIEPGRGYLYSNSDYGLLRLVLERALDRPLTDYVEERITAPLSMVNSRLLGDVWDEMPGLAESYQYGIGGDFRKLSIYKTSPGGNYYFATSAADLVRWARALSDSSSDYYRAVELLKDFGRTVPHRTGHYTFGHTYLDIAGHQIIRHEGVLECNYLTRIPELGLYVITQGNKYFDMENELIVNRILGHDPGSGEVFSSNPVSLSPEEGKRFEGRYLIRNYPDWSTEAETRVLADFHFTENKLIGRFPQDIVYEFIPVGQSFFYWKGTYEIQLEFYEEGSETMTAVMRYNDGYPAETLIRQPPSWQPSVGELEQFKGLYHSSHLDYFWRVESDSEGRLVVRGPTILDKPLIPDREDQFLIRLQKYPGFTFFASLHFHRDEQGRVTHMSVATPRLNHHRFDRIYLYPGSEDH
jgi:CubicO group peptidase (beta-lactamase class C family)